MFLQKQPSYHHNFPYTTIKQCITLMIVTVLYHHSSIITIMVKNNNILYINLLQKNKELSGIGAEYVKRLLFSPRQAFLLPKTTWIATQDPGVRGMDIRMWERCRPGSSWIPAGDAERFICHVRDTFMPCFYILSDGKGRFLQIASFLMRLS